MKIKFLKPKKIFKKGSSVINSNLYWDLALFLVFLMVIFSFVFGFYIFNKVNSGMLSLVDSETTGVDRIKEDRLSKALEYFSTLDKRSKEIINSPSPIIDPSL